MVQIFVIFIQINSSFLIKSKLIIIQCTLDRMTYSIFFDIAITSSHFFPNTPRNPRELSWPPQPLGAPLTSLIDTSHHRFTTTTTIDLHLLHAFNHHIRLQCHTNKSMELSFLHENPKLWVTTNHDSHQHTPQIYNEITNLQVHREQRKPSTVRTRNEPTNPKLHNENPKSHHPNRNGGCIYGGGGTDSKIWK